jgi:nitroimidazol reductase NimA-like FMN-containing flavoprotein (pyridoxamine 5'-phosphate oxidase superfamily)
VNEGRTDDRADLRRTDRAADEAWIRDFLLEAPVGVLATVRDDQPFVNSNLFVFDPDAHAIYLHTARTGRTRDNVERHPAVAFTVYETGRLLPADEALEFSIEYGGVVVFGSARVVDDPVEAERGLQRLLDKYAPHLRPGRDYRAITEAELKRTTVIRLDIESWSGKRKEAEPGFPGAYRYEDRHRADHGRARSPCDP